MPTNQKHSTTLKNNQSFVYYSTFESNYNYSISGNTEFAFELFSVYNDFLSTAGFNNVGWLSWILISPGQSLKGCGRGIFEDTVRKFSWTGWGSAREQLQSSVAKYVGFSLISCRELSVVYVTGPSHLFRTDLVFGVIIY